MNTRAMTDAVRGWQTRASETARNVGSATDHFVRDHTWNSLALAAILGCMIGYLLANQRKAP